MVAKKFLRLENLTFLAAIGGLALGFLAPEFSLQIGFLGEIFLTLLKMMIIPLIFVSVFLAVAKQAGQGELSGIGFKTLAYFFGTSSLACITGLLAANLLPNASQVVSFVGYDASKLGSITFEQVLLSFIPSNAVKALANGEIIQIVVFSILMGIACIRLDSKKRELLVDIADAGHDLIMTVIQWILVIAPIGIFSLVAVVIAKTNFESLSGLGWLFGAIASAALVHVLITLPTIGYFIGRFHPYKFIFNVREALLVALATASSAATLPVSARVLEEQGVNPKTTGFVLPLGASLNMDGSALYQVLVVLFLGRVAGVDFTLAQQLLIFMFVMLSSSGTAGIPGGGLVMMGAMLQMVGIPLELIGIYLLVDRFWDPPITALNVLGDLFGTKTIDRFVKRERVS
ncbi:Proton glutamate symport protein [compost metagenome]